MKKLIIFLFFINILSNNLYLQSNVKNEKNTKKGSNYVPDIQTANKIAEVILKNIYGTDNINKQLPFITHLNQKGVWIISGSLPKLRKGEAFIGGVAQIAIQKNDCKVLYVTHGK